MFVNYFDAFYQPISNKLVINLIKSGGTIMVDFGERLKKLRLQENLTQQQLANRLGVTKSVVSYYELQERYPSPDILLKLASVFHVSTDYLLGLKQSETVDLSGLNDEDIKLVKHLVTHLKNKQIKG